MSTLVDTLVAAGWTAEDFDGDPSALIENDDVEARVVTDAEGDTFLLLGHLPSAAIQFWILDGGDPAPVILRHQPTLAPLTVSALVRDLVQAGVTMTGGSGVSVEPGQLDALDNLREFREAFWQVVPLEGQALARYEGEDTYVEVVETGDGWDLIVGMDEDFEDVYAIPASDDARRIILDHVESVDAEHRAALPDALRNAGVPVTPVQDDDEE